MLELPLSYVNVLWEGIFYILICIGMILYFVVLDRVTNWNYCMEVGEPIILQFLFLHVNDCMPPVCKLLKKTGCASTVLWYSNNQFLKYSWNLNRYSVIMTNKKCIFLVKEIEYTIFRWILGLIVQKTFIV